VIARVGIGPGPRRPGSALIGRFAAFAGERQGAAARQGPRAKRTEARSGCSGRGDAAATSLTSAAASSLGSATTFTAPGRAAAANPALPCGAGAVLTRPDAA
jgi:hypothetical protein